jgi:agmatine/peptidylarginine deiminase
VEYNGGEENISKEERTMKKTVSSVYGKIKRMLLTFPHKKTLTNDIVLQRYQGIFKELKDVEYIILAHKDVHQSIRITAEEIDDNNLILIEASSNYFGYVTEVLGHIAGSVYVCELESSWHTIWAQDGYCCIKKDENTTVLLEPLHFARGGDHNVAEQVAANTDLEVEPTKYYIEGGNILAGDDYILVGKDYLHLNKARTGEGKRKLTNEFKKLFGVSHVIWLGFDEPLNFPIQVFQGKYQPLYHIDMYITLAGKTDNGKELVFVADAKLAKEIVEEEAPEDVIVDSFDKTVEYLAQYNEGGLQFEVKRLPIDLWKFPDGQKKFLTYNNCLIEVFGDEKNVYLPKYSSPAPGSKNRRKLDAELAKIFEENGFKVLQLEGAYEELCKRGGSLHCITKVLDRV